jgi:hypothetical protein
VIAVIAMVVCIRIPADAQVVGALDVSGGLGQPSPGVWLRQSVLSPTLHFSNRYGYLHVDAELLERGGALSLRRQRAEWAASPPAFGVFRLTAAGDYAHDLLAPSSHRSLHSVTSALSAKWGARGLRTTATLVPDGLRVGVGGWRVIGNAIFSLTSGSQFVRVTGARPPRTVQFVDSVFNDTIGEWKRYQAERVVRDSGTVTRLLRWSDLEGRVDYGLGRLTLTAVMSGRPAADSVPAMFWGRVGATMQVNSRVSFTAAVGSTPLPGPAMARSSSRFATLGIRLSPAAILRPSLPHGVRTAATAFAIAPAAPGSYLITVRVPSARVVEISGDFTGWTPVALREVSPNVWRVTLPLTAGTHRVNIRVDGDAWAAPPGLPTVDDEFNGRVGLVVVR